MSYKNTVILFIVLAIITVSWRLLPHAPNIALMGALSVSAGYYLKGNLRFGLPIVAVVISDYVIGHYSWPIMTTVYLGYILYGLIGANMTKMKQIPWLGNTVVGAMLGSVVFFLITNAAVWLWSTMYPQTISGLIHSYINALPFFRNSLMSDIYGTVAFLISIESANIITSVYKQKLPQLAKQIPNTYSKGNDQFDS